MAFSGGVFGLVAGLAIASFLTGHPYVGAIQMGLAGVNLGVLIYNHGRIGKDDE